MDAARVLISIVSHGQAKLVAPLLQDLERILPLDSGLFTWKVVLTENTSNPALEPLAKASKLFDQGRLSLVVNAVPKGFGANHNSAFRRSESDYFIVLNPDIRIERALFPQLIEGMGSGSPAIPIGIMAPRIVSSAGHLEDSARTTPSLLSLVKKGLGLGKGGVESEGEQVFFPDWVAGMFMVIDSRAFSKIQGFDERYFMYYEDVDLCLRLRRINRAIAVNPMCQATHDAQRASRRNVFAALSHARSMLRFLVDLHLRRKFKAAP